MKGIWPPSPARLLSSVILILGLMIISLPSPRQGLALSESPSHQDQKPAPQHYRDRVIGNSSRPLAGSNPSWPAMVIRRSSWPSWWKASAVGPWADPAGSRRPGRHPGQAEHCLGVDLGLHRRGAGQQPGISPRPLGGRPLLRKISVNERHLARMEDYFSRAG